MAEEMYTIQKSTLTNIADKIRTFDGSTAKITPLQMPDKIGMCVTGNLPPCTRKVLNLQFDKNYTSSDGLQLWQYAGDNVHIYFVYCKDNNCKIHFSGGRSSIDKLAPNQWKLQTSSSVTSDDFPLVAGVNWFGVGSDFISMYPTTVDQSKALNPPKLLATVIGGTASGSNSTELWGGYPSSPIAVFTNTINETLYDQPLETKAQIIAAYHVIMIPSQKNVIKLTTIGSMTAKTCPLIFVKDSLVDAYKKATNWSVFKNKIFPISSYTNWID